MARRKSKPVLSHEMVSNINSKQGYQNIEPSSSHSETDSIQQQGSPSQESTKNSLPVVFDKQTKSSTTALQSPPTSNQAADGTLEFSSAEAGNVEHYLAQTLSAKRCQGYLANRRSASFIIHDDESAAGPSEAKELAQSQNLDEGMLVRSLKRTPSAIRLSLSLDGKAEVTSRSGNTPSPPRPRPASVCSPVRRRNAGLQRSLSALEPVTGSVKITNVVHFPGPPMTGRSRDSRTWEFYCDSDARNALTEQAEREESGSATAAISLIRSCSQQKKAMAANSSKRNAHPQKPEFSKKLKADGRKTRKPKLVRATSSVARLQTSAQSGAEPKIATAAHKSSGSGSQKDIFQVFENDSDKENWEPGTQRSIHQRHMPADRPQGARALEETSRILSQSTGMDSSMRRQDSTADRSRWNRFSSEEKENQVHSPHDKLANACIDNAIRGTEDFDCVQNLLSLSQAEWQ